jgi:tetratricopeptide (TPR) repeat protein
MGLAYDDQGDLEHAQHAYEKSLHILEALPGSARDYAMALDDLGALYVTTGQLEVANKLRTKALGLYENLNDHAGVARACSHLAGMDFSEKNMRAGRKQLQRAISEARLANDLDDDDRAAIASLNGWQAELEDDVAASIASYGQSLDLLKRRHGEQHPSTGWGYLLLGKAHAEAGQLQPAMEEMRKGLAILGRTMGDQNPHYLVAELAYSRVLDEAGLHPEAARIKAAATPLLKDTFRGQCVGCTISAAALH